MTTKQIIKWSVLGVISFLGLITALSSFTIVSAGERGIVLRVGAVNRVLSEGLNWKIPFVESVHHTDIRIQKIETPAVAYSKDIQTVDSKIALNFHLEADAVGRIFQEVGTEVKSKIIDPAIQESVKAITAQYTAQELIEFRSKVKDGIKASLTERLLVRSVIVDEVSILNFDFSDAYEKAIEAKQVAQQDALTSKNKLEQVKFEAEQRIAQAKGEAEAIRIQAQAITQQGGEDYVKLQAIKTWNGEGCTSSCFGAGTQMPVPFLNLK